MDTLPGPTKTQLITSDGVILHLLTTSGICQRRHQTVLPQAIAERTKPIGCWELLEWQGDQTYGEQAPAKRYLHGEDTCIKMKETEESQDLTTLPVFKLKASKPHAQTLLLSEPLS